MLYTTRSITFYICYYLTPQWGTSHGRANTCAPVKIDNQVCCDILTCDLLETKTNLLQHVHVTQ